MIFVQTDANWLELPLFYTGFLNTRTWLADVREHADPHLTCILVGNKVDLCDDNSSKRQVSVEEAEIFAKEEGLLFVESSAKSGQNVEKAFEDAVRDILEKIHRGVFDDDRSPGVKQLSKPSNNSNANNVSLTPGASLSKPACCS
ncbi:hypothetical protein D9758_005568 [Tetrapyrgos nigripes]|uniref:Uncharacterized protein n=1 Tax=Tetrapyrgos nigripes TaxID=182062 RepID=A0A8H5LPI4_9AGAR|nr:hypothetical protein D9758_005568 [Tetrapyrgos nigripes]